MIALRVILFLSCVTVMVQAKDHTVTPIVVDIPHQSPTSVNINGMVKPFPEAESWLKEVSSKFGRLDPIVIRLESNEDMYVAAVFARIALKSHDSVYIALPKPDKADPKFYLLPVGSNEASFTFQTANSTSTSTLQLGDHFPDNAREKQINNLDKIQRGEIR
jgi:hypothetical protein